MSNFDNEVVKAATKVILKKVDLDRVIDKALPKIEEAIAKDLQDCIKENFYDVLCEGEFLDKLATAVEGKMLAKLGVKKNAIQKRKAT